MRDPEYRTAYRLAGATNIGNSVQMMVDKFVLDIENPDIRRVISLSNGKAEVSIITLGEKSKAVGQKIVDLVKGKNFPSDVVIAGMFDAEKDSFVVPRGSTVIEANNQLFVVGSRDSIKSLYKYMIK
jgi:trk system potassium uptake protein TrkA